MKTTIILFAVAILATSASVNPFFSQSASDKMAQQVIAALKKSSPDDYAALFPTLAEFYAIMDANGAMYGEYLAVLFL